MISAMRLMHLRKLLQDGRENLFYTWPEWQQTRSDVLKLDRYECQICKQVHKRYRAAAIVHHVLHLRDRPDLALSIWDGEERQLLSVCKRCHEDLHPESKRQIARLAQPVTEERWD